MSNWLPCLSQHRLQTVISFFLPITLMNNPRFRRDPAGYSPASSPPKDRRDNDTTTRQSGDGDVGPGQAEKNMGALAPVELPQPVALCPSFQRRLQQHPLHRPQQTMDLPSTGRALRAWLVVSVARLASYNINYPAPSPHLTQASLF